MLTLLGAGPGRAADAASSLALTYRSFQDSETDLDVYTFSAYAIGAEAADRRVLVIAWGSSGGAPTFSSVTVGGVTATAICVEASTARWIGAFYADVPTGTTVDVVVTFTGGTMLRCGASVYTITGGAAAYSARSGATPNSSSSASSLAATAVTVPAGGAGIAAAWVADNATAITWTQTTGTGTEREDRAVGSLGIRAGLYDTAEAGSQTFTADGGDAVQYRVLAFTWAPA